jgi:hypothetical protein
LHTWFDFEVGGTMKLEDEEEEDEEEEGSNSNDSTNNGTNEKVKFHLLCVWASRQSIW